MKKSYLFIVFILLLSGCSFLGSKPIEQVIVKPKTYVVVPDDSFIDQCQVTKPTPVVEYIEKVAKDKESYFADYAKALIIDLELCNQKLTSLREWKVKQLDIYKDVEIRKED